ncbi:MAG: DUF4112 domain-containing protein [Rhodoferax sp.]|jgi:hypothetical protein|nr:DUF4112 domain-containing protein [Rhodoferax sp.]MBP9683159.1 DUF4112 domain-containing protein [Rhodoferax sp.]
MTIDVQKAREKLKALAWLLDSSVRLPGGFRIGVDAILGLVPILGDLLGLLLSGYIVVQAARLRAPWSVLLRMMLNVAVEGLIGLVPVAGDIFDASWKANQRNVRLLEGYLDQPSNTAATSRRLFVMLTLLCVLFMGLVTVLFALLLRWTWQALL